MTLEIAHGSSIVGTNEVVIASLASYHALIDVYVDPAGNPLADGTEWRLYAKSGGVAAILAAGTFDDGLEPKRILAAVPGAGAGCELRAVTQGPSTVSALSGWIVGYEEEDSIAPMASTVTATHPVNLNTDFGALPAWYPTVTAVVSASSPDALGSVWKLYATLPGTALKFVVAVEDLTLQQQTLFRGFVGGALSWGLMATAVQHPTSNVTASLTGASKTSVSLGGTQASAELTLSGNAAATAMPAQNTYVPVNGNNAWASNIAPQNAAIAAAGTITIGLSGRYCTLATLAFTSGAAPNTIRFGLFKNGVLLPEHVAVTWTDTTAFPNTVTITGIDDFAAGDVLDLRVECTTAAGISVTLTDANFSVLRFPSAS